MAAVPITIGPHETLARAYELMTLNGIRRLPVVSGGRIAGIVTLSDVLAMKPSDPARRLSLAEVAAALDRLVVSTVMSKEPVCVFDSDTVGHAAELMLEHKVGGLPVIDTSHRLQGLVTASDLFRLMAQRWRDDNLRFSGARSSD
jgi:CBS domain-containing protein